MHRKSNKHFFKIDTNTRKHRYKLIDAQAHRHTSTQKPTASSGVMTGCRDMKRADKFVLIWSLCIITCVVGMCVVVNVCCGEFVFCGCVLWWMCVI